LGLSAPEARKKVAHGENRGSRRQKFQAPAGATENQLWKFSFAPPGLCRLIAESHGFTVSYYRSLLRSFKQI
jgi:hypothetical protein